jgi:adenosine deaminase
MSWYRHDLTREQTEYYHHLPKVELHRHLEGSLRVSTISEIARKHGITLPARPGLRAMVQMQPNDTLDFNTFLSKFQTLRLFYRSPEIIRRVTREAIQDAAEDGVVYMELRFTPVALARLQGFQLAEVMDWVCESASQASKDFGITTRLIASVNRHEDTALAEEVVTLALERRSKGIVAMDLAGSEANFSAEPFIPVLRRAQQNGLALTIHAGEWNGPDNIRQALVDLNADRIGHGVRILEDPAVVELAIERGVPLEVCVTSNYQSGVFSSLEEHPILRMIAAGLNVTINTDDPGISQITLSDEYLLVMEKMKMSPTVLRERILAAGRAAFLPPAERAALLKTLEQRLDEVLRP